MYGLWILFIIFAAVAVGAFVIGGLSYPLYSKYKEQTHYSYQYATGHWDTDYYTGHSRDKKYIKEEDIPTIAERAMFEGNPLYPVPKLMDKYELMQFYYDIME